MNNLAGSGPTKKPPPASLRGMRTTLASSVCNDAIARATCNVRACVTGCSVRADVHVSRLNFRRLHFTCVIWNTGGVGPSL